MAKGIEYVSGFCGVSVEDAWDIVMGVDDKRRPNIFQKEENAVIRQFRDTLGG